MNEDEQEELDWRKWRAELKFVPVIVDKHEVTIGWGDGGERRVRFVALLSGPNGWYVETHCYEAGQRRTFNLANIGAVTTADGVKFENFHEWMVNRATIAPAVADELAIRLPPKDQRR